MPVNPNTQFAHIESIMAAKEAQRHLEETEAARQPMYDAEAVSKALQEASFQSLQLEWQLNS